MKYNMLQAREHTDYTKKCTRSKKIRTYNNRGQNGDEEEEGWCKREIMLPKTGAYCIKTTE